MNRLDSALVLTVAGPAVAADWPQWLGPKRDSVWRETGILDKFPEGGPKVLWRTPVSGGFAGPAVAGGRVYVADYVTDANVKKEVYTRTDFKGKERLLCLDAKTGKELWKHEYDCRYTVSYPIGPRCTPTVADGKVYFLGTEGNLTCLDAAKGTVVWAKDFKTGLRCEDGHLGLRQPPARRWQAALLRRRRRGELRGRVRQGHRQGGLEGADGRGAGLQPADDDRGRRDEATARSGTPTSINALDPATGKKYWTVPLQAGNSKRRS